MRLILVVVLCLLLAGAFDAASSHPSIHSMVVDGQIMEIVEEARLTKKSDGEVHKAWISPNGRYVVYTNTIDRGVQLCLMRTTGGRPVVLISEYDPDDGSAFETWDVEYGLEVAWSPDSRLFAVPAVYISFDGESYTKTRHIAVFDNGGRSITTFALPEDANLYAVDGALLWNPQGTRLASACRSRTRHPEGAWVETFSLMIFDLLSNSSETSDLGKSRILGLESWSEDGRFVRYVTVTDEERTLMETSIDGTTTRVIDANYPARVSPDSMYILHVERVVEAEHRVTGEAVRLFERIDGTDVFGWLPNSRMIAYRRPPEELKDEIGKRERSLRSLWLAVVDDNPMNHLCVALDSSWRPPSWSDDCRFMTYIRDKRLYVVEFGLRDPDTVAEKIAAGIPLTEEEKQEIAVNNAKQIGTAMQMYETDKGRYPLTENAVDSLLLYSRNEKIFFAPGTENIAFQYVQPTLPIERPADTVVGIIDLGYGWRVVLYADGHVHLEEKE